MSDPGGAAVDLDLPVSGMSHWTGREWLICLNKHDPEVRQRPPLLE